jgi:hypothetical protein
MDIGNRFQILTELNSVTEYVQVCLSLKEALETFSKHVTWSCDTTDERHGQSVYVYSQKTEEFVMAYDFEGIRMRSKKRTHGQ